MVFESVVLNYRLVCNAIMFVCCLCLVCLWPQPAPASYDPLFVTPYLKRGAIAEAQRRAEVRPFLAGVRSYSGYLTVDERHNSNLFFWFFPKRGAWSTAPLVVWLQGGPGTSSLFAVFVENGPYVLEGNQLTERRYSWTSHFNVLYLDNPVGTGFSFTESAAGYATDQRMVGEALFEALRQFLLLFPQLQRSKLILSGESYAGKYVPSLAHAILTKNSTNPPINVYGLFVGNPLINPQDMLTHWSPYLAAHGLLDERGRDILLARETLILQRALAGRWEEAGELFENTFFEGIAKNTTLFEQLSAIPNHYNMLQDSLAAEIGNYAQFLDQNRTKAALHLRGDRFGANDGTVFRKLRADLMKSTNPRIGIALDNFRTLLYFGQFDIICPYNLHLHVMANMNWSGRWDYRQSRRRPLRWKRSLCGYYKKARKYIEVMIRNAGHFAPTDQPEWTLALLRKFVNGDFDRPSHPFDLSF